MTSTVAAAALCGAGPAAAAAGMQESSVPVAITTPAERAGLAASQEDRPAQLEAGEPVLGPGMWHSTREGRTWYGAYRTFPDRFAYCVDAGLRTPRPEHFPGTRQDRALDAPETAWALSTWIDSSSVDVHAALSTMVKLDEALPHRHAIEPRRPGELGPAFAGAAEVYEEIAGEAVRWAGPYTLEVELDAAEAEEHSEDARGMPSRARATIGLTSAAGEHVAGHTVELSVEGGRAVESAVTTGQEPLTVDVVDLAPGAVTIEATVSGLPATTLEVHRPSGPEADDVQSVVTEGKPVTVGAQAGLDVSKLPEHTPVPLPTFTRPVPQPSFSAIVPTVTAEPAPSEPDTDQPAPETSEPPAPATETPGPERPERSPADAADEHEGDEPTVAESEPPRAGGEPEGEPVASPSAELPRTGTGTHLALGLALTLVGVGGIALVFARRR